MISLKRMYSSRFLRFISIILRNECGSGNGYVDNPNDSGGITVYGITRKSHPTLSIWKSLLAMSSFNGRKAWRPTDAQWEEIYGCYLDGYYRPLSIENITCESLALQVFDFGVNAGPRKAATTLQKLVHTNIDGAVGPNTLAATNTMNCDSLTDRYKQARKDYYTAIATGKNRGFLKGWLNRVENTRI